MKITEVMAKSVLTKSKLPASDYCINPFVGCGHGCKYCYATFIGRWKGHEEEWGTYVDVKVNSAGVLAGELAKEPKKGLVLLGSMTDAYQPLEKRFGLTRELLRLLAASDFPISILTKSDLVLRDLDILRQARTCEVGFSISYLDDHYRRALEPCASSIERRLAALEKCHAAGLVTYAFVGPIFPGVTDLSAILDRVRPHVSFLMAEALNIRCGNWARLESVLKDLVGSDLAEYRKRVLSSDFWAEQESVFRTFCQKWGIRNAGFFRHEVKRGVA